MTAAERATPAGVPETAFARPTEDVLEEVERLIDALATHTDPRVGATATALLERIDLVHRAALTSLMGTIQSMAGDAFVNRLTADPAIRLLLMSYDLLAVDRRTLADEALDAVRGHLQAHGITVELMEVLGGVVSVRLHGPPAGHPALEGARLDVQEALRAGLLGFQELAVHVGAGAHAAPKEPAFVPIETLRRATRPVHHAVCRADEIPDGHTRSAVVAGRGVLLARVEGEFFAVRNTCGESPLPLEYSTLAGTELTCSWHGCRYDIRTGHRLDRPDAGHAEHLRVLPVRVHEGMVEIAVGTVGAA